MIRLKTLITESTAPFDIKAAKVWLSNVELLSINNFGGGKFKIAWKSAGEQRNYVGEAENTKIKTNVGGRELPAIVPHGNGTLTGPGIGTSTGYFANGHMDGFHKYKSSDREGSGQYKNGSRDGYHEIRRSDGMEFKGNYKNDKFDGYGEFKWNENGGWFKGNLKNGNFLNGTLRNSEGGLYTGGWNADEKYDGYGEFKWPSGDTYKGNWENDTLSGYGVYTWKDGSKYKGYWENDTMSGYGKMYDAEGKLTEKGFYSNGVYTGDSKNKSNDDQIGSGWFEYSGDDLYLYQQRDGDWWAKNVNTQREYNISTNTKYQSSVDLLNGAKDRNELIAK